MFENEADDYITYTGYINHECKKFHLQTFTVDQFKSLIFINGPQSPHNTDVHIQLLSKQDKDNTVKDLMTECQSLMNLKK